jgi:hypothetical protein
MSRLRHPAVVAFVAAVVAGGGAACTSEAPQAAGGESRVIESGKPTAAKEATDYATEGTRFEVFTAGDAGFALELPAGWEIREDERDIRVAAVEPVSGDDYAASINVTASPVPAPVDVSFEEFAGLMPQVFERLFGEITIEEESFANMAGEKAARHEFSGDDRGTKVRAQTTSLLAGGKVYMVIYVAAAEAFDEHRVAAERAVESFELR